MDTLDLEGPAPARPSLSERLSALWSSMTLRRHQRFEQLSQEEEIPEVDKAIQDAGRREGWRWCPEDDAGIFSTIIFSYVSGLIRIGYRKPLLQEDLWDVSHHDEANIICGRFNELWEGTKRRSKSPKGSVLLAMWRTNGRLFIRIGCIKLVDTILTFMAPLLLERLLLSLQNGSPSVVPLAFACAMFLCGMTEVLVNNRQMHYTMRMTMHLKSQMIGMLYGKSLRLHSAARAEFGTGAIVNLQSNDAQKLWWLPVFMHTLWSAPLQILVVCALLVRVMGVWSAAAGLAVTVLLIPTSSFVGRRLSKARKAVVGHTDARVKLTTEVILGIRAIKLYSWESPFVTRIMGLRDKELSSIRLAAVYNAFNTMLFLGGPMLISLAAFTVYGALGYQLTAAVAFPSLSLFNLLRFPLQMLPDQILNLIQGRVALRRISDFMEADEMEQEEARPAARAGETAVLVRHGSFAWESGSPSNLNDIHLEATAGQLVMVVGEVGSGKSSLLYALLGEMIGRGGGEVRVSGRVAYTSQDPWIVNSTLRQNIVMGLPFDQDRYDRTLDACALRPDIAELAGGDAAEIGEKGINLSGGQRARVSLARACYTGADTFLLDDPLSAVDAHVGQQLFERCICGMLGSSTRILVTHQLQFLPSADVIVVLSGGRIMQTGSYAALTSAGVEFRQFAVAEESGSETEEEPEDSLPLIAQEVAHDLMTYMPQTSQAELSEAAAETAHPEGAPRNIPDMLGYDDVAPSSSQASSSGDENRPPLNDTASPPQKREHPAVLKHSANSMDLGSQLLHTSLADTAQAGQSQIDAHNWQQAGRHSTEARSSFASSSAQLKPISEAAMPGVSSRRKSEDLGRAGSNRLRRAGSKGSQAGLAKAGSSEPHKHSPAFGKVVEKEERATGRVELTLYKAYLRAWSKHAYVLPVAVLLLAAVERTLNVTQNYWLSVWTDATVETAAHHTVLDNRSYIGVYFALGAISILFQGCRLLVVVKGSINATKQLHADLLEKIVRLPLSFFSSQPTGRLLNRFARDTEAVDTKVPNALGSFLNCLVNVVGSLAINLFVTPLVIIPVLPMAYIYDTIRRRFVTTSREIKRLDSLAMSPIFGMFSETLQGLVSVRAFRLQQSFMLRHNELLDASTRCWWPLVCVNRWLSVRLELIGTTLVFCTAVAAAVVLPRSAGLAGLAITAALNLTGLMNWTVRQATELEVQMNSVERILAYTKDYKAEKPATVPHRRPPAGWPSRGQITLSNLVVKYRPDLPPVLKGLSLTINGGEKVGVAGRTGGGKSTLMMALFRIVEPASGTIVIDGLDITDMGLSDLRSRLALVPQDPVIFSGTVRANLDPFDSINGDAPIWQALERAGLQRTIADLPGGLDADIAEGGANLSTGQRQLLCMARALLRQAQILVLDEATSSIDNETDGLIQSTVRIAFAKCTVLTVAHRLHTISDCDRILVLDAGSVKEFDSPQKLLKDPSSAFYGLVAETTRQQRRLQ